MILNVNNLSFGYDKRLVLKNLEFGIEKPGVLAVVGPNGVGKSTLFKLILGLLKPKEGSIEIENKTISEYSRRELAKEMAYIPQSHYPTYNYSVLNTVIMGMVGDINMFSTPSKKHIDAALEALSELGISHLATRGYAQISGGERQLTLIARALVQKAKILIMDEPTANLDFGNQLHVMEKIRELSKEGYTIIVSLHNPQHAFLYSDTSLVLHEGRVLAYGDTKTVVNHSVLESIYNIGINLLEVENEGEITLVPMPKMRRKK